MVLGLEDHHTSRFIFLECCFVTTRVCFYGTTAELFVNVMFCTSSALRFGNLWFSESRADLQTGEYIAPALSTQVHINLYHLDYACIFLFQLPLLHRYRQCLLCTVDVLPCADSANTCSCTCMFVHVNDIWLIAVDGRLCHSVQTDQRHLVCIRCCRCLVTKTELSQALRYVFLPMIIVHVEGIMQQLKTVMKCSPRIIAEQWPFVMVGALFALFLVINNGIVVGMSRECYPKC